MIRMDHFTSRCYGAVLFEVCINKNRLLLTQVSRSSISRVQVGGVNKSTGDGAVVEWPVVVGVDCLILCCRSYYCVDKGGVNCLEYFLVLTSNGKTVWLYLVKSV